MQLHDIDVAPQFWKLVDEGREEMSLMEAILKRLSHDDLVRFYTEFEYAVTDIQEKIEPQASELQIPPEDISGWIVSKGSAFYLELYNTPSLLLQIDVKEIDWNCNVGGLAIEIYENTFNDDIPVDSIQRWAF